MVSYTLLRIAYVDFRRGFAKAVPRTFQSGVGAIEIPVVAFRVIGDDIGMRLQPVGDDLHIVQVDWMTVIEAVACCAELAVKATMPSNSTGMVSSTTPI